MEVCRRIRSLKFSKSKKKKKMRVQTIRHHHLDADILLAMTAKRMTTVQRQSTSVPFVGRQRKSSLQPK
jgi:hypothetical protein